MVPARPRNECILHNDEWWFVITDIVAALTGAADPSDYWKRVRMGSPQRASGFVAPDYAQVCRELQRKGMTLMLPANTG